MITFILSVFFAVYFIRLPLLIFKATSAVFISETVDVYENSIA